MSKYDYLVIGAGLYGSVYAQQLKEAGKKVLVIDRRNHIGGNCHSYLYEDTNIVVHTYGTHIFHTDDKAIWDYINSFGEFNRYQHRVLTKYNGKVYAMPINLGTINAFFGVNLVPAEVDAFLEGQKGTFVTPKNLEEKAISLIGAPLYEAFIKGYTQKQWQCDPQQLPASIINRLPVRNSYNDCYFNDRYQGMPVDGYTPIFERMLKDIPVQLEADFFENREYWMNQADNVLYTGPIDRYFDYCCGHLTWRSLRFETDLLNVPDYQGTSVMNYADTNVGYTRIHEPKHLHPEREMATDRTVIIREFPDTNPEEPYYPVNTEQDRIRYRSYKELTSSENKVIFGGRLAQYKYFDMHHVIAAALAHVQRELSGLKLGIDGDPL